LSVARPKPSFRLYLITDRKLAKTGIVAACEQALAAAREFPGSVALQLREKDLGGRELLELARELRKLCTRYGAPLFVNDRIDVALACEADGVHLPADSFSIADARVLMGPGKLIGCSTHRIEEVNAAEKSRADFVVFGPVFDPISKARYGAPVGIEGLRVACQASSLPVYGLGGITASRIPETRDTGAAGVAVIGSVFGADSPGNATRSLLDAISDHLR
jgi:thiamine-phosphate pyrophosphorylase